MVKSKSLFIFLFSCLTLLLVFSQGFTVASGVNGTSDISQSALGNGLDSNTINTTSYSQSGSIVNLSKVSETGSDPDQVVKIGVLANRGNDIALKEYGPTARYLSERLAPIQFEITPLGFNETETAARSHQISFIVANPSVYTYLEYFGLAQRIATLQVPGDPSPQPLFGGVIFTLSNRSDINSIQDLRGKRFSAVDPGSLGGWQAALKEIISGGINPKKDFITLNFSKTHDASVFAVLKGEADAGTVRSTQLERMAKEGKINLAEIKVLNSMKSEYPNYPYILSTPLYPEWPFASVTGTDLDLSKKVSVSLLLMDENDPAAKAVSGAGWSIPQDHTTVHELLRTLNLPPYENYGKPTIEQIFHQYWQTIAAIIIGILVLSLLLVYTWRTKRKLALALLQLKENECVLLKSKEELESINNELAETQNRMIDSIQYAKLIQQSVIPSARELNRCLQDYFVISKPLHIVGGDFCFFRETKDGFCIAAVDCTGHGVPGAFMTMMVNALLNRVIDTNPDISPGAMLGHLHHLVQDTLRGQVDSSHLENGLDIGLCRVSTKDGTLIFAGAGLPLFIDEGGEIKEISGDSIHLGFSSNKTESWFIDKRISFSNTNTYYLITDGILDLAGGECGYGLGRKGIISLLKRYHGILLSDVRGKLLSDLEVYQNHFIPKDDMLIIGFQVKVAEDKGNV